MDGLLFKTPFLHAHILLVVVHLGLVFHLHVSPDLVGLTHVLHDVVHLASASIVNVLLAPSQPNSAVLLKHKVSASSAKNWGYVFHYINYTMGFYYLKADSQYLGRPFVQNKSQDKSQCSTFSSLCDSVVILKLMNKKMIKK